MHALIKLRARAGMGAISIAYLLGGMSVNEWMQAIHNANLGILLVPIKLALAYPLAYHACNGMRHLVRMRRMCCATA
jgi:succinate dehydrogenase/fumarate reductase cytochrome b subunit